MPNEKYLNKSNDSLRVLRKELSLIQEKLESNQKLHHTIKHSARYKIGDFVVFKIFKKLFRISKITEDSNFKSLKINTETILGSINQIQSLLGNVSDFSEEEIIAEFQEALKYRPIIGEEIISDDIYYFNLFDRWSKKLLQILRKEKVETSMKFSVIMPVFNRKEIIKDSIKSILDQSYKNFELIIIDDGSSDNTLSSILDFNDDRIKYFYQSKQGVSAARNAALQKTSGEYVTYLDSDNTWEPEFLKVFADFFSNNKDTQTAFSGQKIYSSLDEETVLTSIRVNEFYPRMIENKNYIDLNCFVHSRTVFEKLGGFDLRLRRFIDWELISRYSLHHAPKLIPALVSNYFFNKTDDQITGLEGYVQNLKTLRSITSGDQINNSVNHRLPKQYQNRLSSDKYFCQLDISDKKVEIVISKVRSVEKLNACIEALLTYTPILPKKIKILKSETISPKDFNHEKVEYIDNIKQIDTKKDIAFIHSNCVVTRGWLSALYECKLNNFEYDVFTPSHIKVASPSHYNSVIPFADSQFEIDDSLSHRQHNIVQNKRTSNHVFVELNTTTSKCKFISKDFFIKGNIETLFASREIKSSDTLRILHTPYCKIYSL